MDIQERLFRKYPLQVGKRYKQTSLADWGIYAEARPFLQKELIVVKHLKSGLYQTQLPSGEQFSFPKSALSPVADESYDYPELSKESE